MGSFNQNPIQTSTQAKGNVRTSTQQQILATLRNQLGAAEGTLLPPRQVGTSRVPIVSNLRVGSVTSFLGGTQFALIFTQPVTTPANSPIDHYNVYIAGLNGNLNQLNGPNTCINSPATVRVTTVNAQPVVFYVQTVLTNGLSSPILQSPTCTSSTIAGQIGSSDIPAGTIGLDQLAPETPNALISFAAGTGDPILIDSANNSVFLTNGAGIPDWTALPLSVANGGTGTTTPGLIAGTNITISGTWPDQTITSTGGGGSPTAVDLTGQTANISSTNIIASLTATGMYQVAAYLAVTQAATTSSTLPALTIGYTDGNSSVGQSGTVTANNTGNTTTTVVTGVATVYAASGTALTYSTTGFATSGATGMQYSLHIRVSSLG